MGLGVSPGRRLEPKRPIWQPRFTTYIAILPVYRLETARSGGKDNGILDISGGISTAQKWTMALCFFTGHDGGIVGPGRWIIHRPDQLFALYLIAVNVRFRVR